VPQNVATKARKSWLAKCDT